MALAKSSFLDRNLSHKTISYGKSCLYVGQSLPLSGSHFAHLQNERIVPLNPDSSSQHHN